MLNKVTVVMPVYNGAKFLTASIPSVLAQSLEAFEFIIIDDCSKDSSRELLEDWANKDCRIRLYFNEVNRGIFSTLNRLVDLSDSDLIKIFCQDDVMMPDCLMRQVDFMEKYPELGFSRCLGTQELDEMSGGKTDKRYESQLPEVIYPEASALAFFTFGNIPGNLTNLICRKSALVVSGLFNQSYPYAGDFEMWVRMSKEFPFGIQREALVYVHSHSAQGSVTLNKHNELIAQLNSILEGLYERIPLGLKAVAKRHGSINYVVQQVSWTIKRLLEGKWGAVREFWSVRTYAYPWPVCVLLYFITGGRRWGYRTTTCYLLAKVIDFNSSRKKNINV